MSMMQHDSFGNGSGLDDHHVAKAVRGFWYNVLDVLFNVIIIVAIVAIIRTFVVSPFEVEGNSMIPTLEDNQYIIINKIGYIIGEPGRGDVVVFRPPSENKKYYVKRIIGLPGEDIVIQGGDVYLKKDDQKILIQEDYLNERNNGHTFVSNAGTNDDEVVFEVPYDAYFLLGDNRQGSLDSRNFRDSSGNPIPYVTQDRIAGRVWLIALPITKSHALEIPAYEGINQ